MRSLSRPASGREQAVSLDDLPRDTGRAEEDPLGADELRNRLIGLGIDLGEPLSSSDDDEPPAPPPGGAGAAGAGPDRAAPSTFVTGGGEAAPSAEASGAGPARGRRGWTLLNEVERRQASLREELSGYVRGVTSERVVPEADAAPRGQGGSDVTAADFARMVQSIMDTRLEDIGLASDDEDDENITAEDVEDYLNPFLNHPDERVREGYRRIRELDGVLTQKSAEARAYDEAANPAKHAEEEERRARRRRDRVVRRLRHERQRRRRAAAIKRMEEEGRPERGDGDGDGHGDGDADAASVATGATGQSRATSAGRSTLRPEEEDIVERLLALDDDELDLLLGDPYDLAAVAEEDDGGSGAGAPAGPGGDAQSVASYSTVRTHRSQMDEIDRKLHRLASLRGDADAASVCGDPAGDGASALGSRLPGIPEGAESPAPSTAAARSAAHGASPQKDWLRDQREEKENRRREREIDRRLRELRKGGEAGEGEVDADTIAELVRRGREELGGGQRVET